MKLRAVLRSFFERYELAWEVLMMLLAAGFVVIGFLPDFLDLSARDLELLDSLDLLITTIFVFEFVIRLSIAESRKGYLKEHWMDLVAIAPSVRWLRITRVARVIRLLRLVRLVRAMDTFKSLGASFGRFGSLNGMQWMILALAGVMLLTSVLFYLFEYGVNQKVQTYWDALYAAIVTWTTPGYGDIAPVTAEGRLAGVVLITSGLIAWGLFIANLAAFLSSRRVAQAGQFSDIRDELCRIDDMTRDELVSLRGAVDALIEDRINGKKS